MDLLENFGLGGDHTYHHVGEVREDVRISGQTGQQYLLILNHIEEPMALPDTGNTRGFNIIFSVSSLMELSRQRNHFFVMTPAFRSTL